MKVVIFGSRQFTNYKVLCTFISYLQTISEPFYPITEIVSGRAKGADQLGERWATDNNVPVKIFIPDWAGFGKKAGILRNIEMADYCDAAIGFDMETPGTTHMINYLRKIGKKLAICPEQNFSLWEKS